jgi:hypothetical protein
MESCKTPSLCDEEEVRSDSFLDITDYIVDTCGGLALVGRFAYYFHNALCYI